MNSTPVYLPSVSNFFQKKKQSDFGLNSTYSSVIWLSSHKQVGRWDPLILIVSKLSFIWFLAMKPKKKKKKLSDFGLNSTADICSLYNYPSVPNFFPKKKILGTGRVRIRYGRGWMKPNYVVLGKKLKPFICLSPLQNPQP